MSRYIFIGLAGVAGAVCRFELGVWGAYFNPYMFPFPTLLTNFIGCFLLGWLTVFFATRQAFPPIISTALGTGFVGSFTTFSTFSVETLQLFQQDHWIVGAIYIAVSWVGGLWLAKAGCLLAGRIKWVEGKRAS